MFTGAKNSSDGTESNYAIDEMSVEDKRVDRLSEYMDLFGDKYNLDKIARLPSEKIKIGSVTVTQQNEARGNP